MRLRVAVNHGSTLELRTTLGAERGAKAAADAGNNMVGIMVVVVVVELVVECHTKWVQRSDKK